MIEVSGLVRSFGGRTVVQSVSFSVADGEVVGLLGPNGAGKTTTLRMLLGVLRPDEGRVTVEGPVGYQPESLAAYDSLSVRSHLSFLARVKGLSRGDAEVAIERCELSALARRPVARLSKGQRQRAGLAGALLGEPPAVVLDEPTQGLDPKQSVSARALFREEADRGAAVLISTHRLSEAAAVCDRVVIVVDGAVVDEGPPGSASELEERFLAAIR